MEPVTETEDDVLSFPEFFTGFELDNLWDSATDDEVLTSMLAFSQIPSLNDENNEQISAPSPKKARFAQCTEDDLVALETARHEKKTVDSTLWAVRLLKGS